MKQTKFLEFLKNNTGKAVNRYKSLLIVLVMASLVLTFLLYNGVEFIKAKYSQGEIVKKTIIAKKSFRYVDLNATNSLLKRRIDASPRVYLYYPGIKATIEGKIRNAFDSARYYKEIHSKNIKNRDISESIFASGLGVKLDKKILDEFYYLNYNKNIENYVLRMIGNIYGRGVLSEPSKNNGKIEILNVFTNTSKTVDYSQTFFTISRIGGFSYYYIKRYLNFLPSYLRNDIYKLVTSIVQPNIVYSKYLTIKKIEEIKKNTQPIFIHVNKGALIASSGELISKSKALELNTYDSEFNLRNNIPSLAGFFLIIIILLAVSYIFPYRYIRKFRASIDFRNIIFIISMLILSVMVIRAGVIFANAFSMYFPFIDKQDIYYLVPFAFGPMLIRIILNSEVSVIYISIFSILTSMIFKDSIFFLIYTFAGSFIASYEVFDFSSWGKIIKAGVITGTLNVIMVISFSLAGLNLISVQSIYKILFAFMSGIVASVIVIGLIPLLERIFGYTTDFKLLEISSSNHPLLKQLSVVAPGTYQHSMMVATLSESAATAIGANPLLARVASLYHDIGKTVKPNYYIENIAAHDNPHDTLNPTMSSLIISSHPKEGQELARKFKLGDKVGNIVGEHHGTSMIGSFFEKAVKEGKSGPISKDAFRYNGKKPQTKEAGIIMLADSVEAISRTMDNISPSRLELMVGRTINRIYNDGQLDECELTLKDLHAIGNAFVKVLNSIFHQRIPYAGRMEPDAYEKDKEGSKYNESTEKTENKPKVSPLYRY